MTANLTRSVLLLGLAAAFTATLPIFAVSLVLGVAATSFAYQERRAIERDERDRGIELARRSVQARRWTVITLLVVCGLVLTSFLSFA